MDEISKENLRELAVSEPKKVFINVILIPAIHKAVEAIYHGSPLKSVRPLRGLIGCLDENAQKNLKKHVEKLRQFEANPKTTSRAEIEQLFTDIMVHLHKTYLRGFTRRLEKEDFSKLEDDKH